MNKDCETCQIIADQKGNILTGSHWLVSLAPDQGYLGRCYITLRQHKPDLSSLSKEEWSELAVIAKRLEEACKKAFGAAPFNWACMMNNSFQIEPSTPHVHWHFRPRYANSVAVNEVTFVDPLFGHHYDREQRRKVDEKTFQSIIDKIKANI